jgi:intein-encoded DNA endonuclease-like protein
MWLAVKQWQQIKHMDIQDPVRQCYEWQKGNLRFESWAKEMKEELENIGLAYIRHSQQECNIRRLRRIIRERCNDIERHNLSTIMAEKMSLVLYQEMKYKWSREEYIKLCCRNERNGLAWMKAGVWKLRGIRRGWKKGTCPYEGAMKILSI